jgi:D-sedoheptulose 7-phosphate isomerase
MDRTLIDNAGGLREILESVSVEESERLSNLALTIATQLKGGGSIFWCGNGGSAAESQHMAAELMGKFLLFREPYRSLSLTTDTSVITGVSNDFNFAEIFSRQIEGLSKAGDFLVCFSTSGESENVNRALLRAAEIGVHTVAFLGSGGGTSKELSEYSFIIKSDVTARIQEVQTLYGHTLCQLVEQYLELFKSE